MSGGAFRTQSHFVMPAVAAALLVMVAGCAGPPQPPPPTGFTHPQHGRVTTDDARYAAARKECERTVYQQGVEIAGRRVTDPDEAIRAAAASLVQQARPAGSSGDGAIPAGIQKPAYMERLHELDRKADACMIEAGWKQDAVEQKPRSADHRRLLLKLHREGRIKLTPAEVAEYEKGLWW